MPTPGGSPSYRPTIVRYTYTVYSAKAPSLPDPLDDDPVIYPNYSPFSLSPHPPSSASEKGKSAVGNLSRGETPGNSGNGKVGLCSTLKASTVSPTVSNTCLAYPPIAVTAIKQIFV